MSRIFGVFLSFSIVAAATVPGAFAITPLNGEMLDTRSSQSLIILVKPLTERQKCKALNRCRQKYTYCYDKLVRAHKNIETEKITCVTPYQKCINATFSGFDFFFTRWFDPSYLDCRQYPG